MTSSDTDIRRCMRELQICVLIPTYNNAGTLAAVIDDCRRWTDAVLVVNDGSTDTTDTVLSAYAAQGVRIVSYPHNRGKGYALKQGFACARSHGFRYAITMDADGQHFAADIPHFVDAIAARPDALIVGSRDITAENMPTGNTFANRFSNFWFRVQTLQVLPDTQTGYRLYPLARMGRMWWLTSRYEAELEMLVYAAWHGIPLVSIPVRVYYPPAGERVSHFRPTADFLRISLLNTVLCFLAVVYGGPRMLLTKLINRLSTK